jgi:serine/threonine-protein phosphatase 5
VFGVLRRLLIAAWVVAAKTYAKAVDFYSKSLELHETAPVLGNRAFANLKLEAFGLAIADASRALEVDPKFVKGYYRRGSANMALGKYKPARRDFRVVLTVRPDDPAAKAQLKMCVSEIRRKAFEDAIATDKTAGPWDAVKSQLGSMTVPKDYSGPVMDETGPTREYCRQLMEHCRMQKVPPKKDVWRLLELAQAHFKAQSTLVRVAIPDSAPTDGTDEAAAAEASSGASEGVGSQPDGCVCVMGDTHGQFYDTLHVFAQTGEPCSSRTLLFNGDFVDRGSFSVENVLVLLAWQLACPRNFCMLRGNHETANMNKVYGFDVSRRVSAALTVLLLCVWP